MHFLPDRHQAETRLKNGKGDAIATVFLRDASSAGILVYLASTGTFLAPSPGIPPKFISLLTGNSNFFCVNMDCDSSCGKFAAPEPLVEIFSQWANVGSLTVGGSHVIRRLGAMSVQDIAFLAANADEATAAGFGDEWRAARSEGLFA